MIAALILSPLFAGPVLLCLWFIADGLRDGAVRTNGRAYIRAVEPAWFWTWIATYAAFGAILILLLTQVAIWI